MAPRAMLILCLFSFYSNARSGFDFNIQTETEELSRTITQSQGQVETAIMGIGRSPTAIIANLQNQGWTAFNFPISEFSNWFTHEAKWSERNDVKCSKSEETLFKLFDELIPRSFFKNKKVIVVDFAHTGSTLSNFVVELRKYALVRNLRLPEITAAYIGQPTEAVEAILRDEKIVFTKQPVSSNMARVMGADGFAPYSEFGPLQISNGRSIYWPDGDVTNTGLVAVDPKTQIKSRAEYFRFKDQILNGKVPFWSPSADASRGNCLRLLL